MFKELLTTTDDGDERELKTDYGLLRRSHPMFALHYQEFRLCTGLAQTKK